MSLEIASWNDIIPALHENYKIWSPGLTKGDYRQYISNQLQAPWSRENLYYVIYRHGRELAVSCKVYKLYFQARGKTFAIVGLGALYTQEKFRGHGLAKRLLGNLIDHFKSQSMDGILLFSDIGVDFYMSCGFEQFSSTDFTILLPQNNQRDPAPERIHPDKNFVHYTLSGEPTERRTEQESNSFRLHTCASSDLIEAMTRHHIRWLAKQPFGIRRTEDYCAYKLGRERFLTLHSKLNWPALNITIANLSTNEFAYAITEYGGTTMRVLEIIGSQMACMSLWQELYRKASSLGMRRIRGWQSVTADLPPRFSCQSAPSNNQMTPTTSNRSPIQYIDRDWGKPMLLPINKSIANWVTISPCPLLEPDHL